MFQMQFLAFPRHILKLAFIQFKLLTMREKKIIINKHMRDVGEDVSVKFQLDDGSKCFYQRFYQIMELNTSDNTRKTFQTVF